MSPPDSIEFTTIGVTPDLRDELRETRDDHGFSNYGSLLRAMKEQFDPADGGTE